VPDLNNAVPTALTMCEQLGRSWALRSSLGLSFRERETTNATDTIFAAPLPGPDWRGTPAASITPTPAPVSEPGLRVERMGAAIEAHGPDRAAVVELLTDLWALLWPDGGPLSTPIESQQGQLVTGVLGRPQITSGTVGTYHLWRFVAARPVQQIIVVNGGDEAGRDESGEVVATFTLAADCVKFDWDVNVP